MTDSWSGTNLIGPDSIYGFRIWPIWVHIDLKPNLFPQVQPSKCSLLNKYLRPRNIFKKLKCQGLSTGHWAVHLSRTPGTPRSKQYILYYLNMYRLFYWIILVLTNFWIWSGLRNQRWLRLWTILWIPYTDRRK